MTCPSLNQQTRSKLMKLSAASPSKDGCFISSQLSMERARLKAEEDIQGGEKPGTKRWKGGQLEYAVHDA